MKEVFIKYNPYKVETEITINGNPPKENSALNVKGRRLQEWIEDLPQILRNEENSNEFKLTFHGTIPDHEDVLSVIKSSSDVKFEYNNIPPKEKIAEKIGLLDDIFHDILNGPFNELNDDAMKHAFELAMTSDFEVNVVATMSAGKSTLINALLGRKLMPSKQEACTAVITKIRDNDTSQYSAVVYDKNNNEIERQNNVTLDIMGRLNNNPDVSTIKIEGDIPFVTNGDVTLVLVDTPGPNNSRDPAHHETTHGMLAKSSKTLVLYILNAGQLSVNDDNTLLNTVANSMKIGGKQSKDRFLFVINKLDEYRQGEDSIESALQKTRSYLEDKGIENPNIYPAAALPALDIIRFISKDNAMSEDDIDEMEMKVKKFNRNEEFHFDSSKYITLPPSVRGEINNVLEKAKKEGDKYREALVHTGIVPLEKAIDLYVSKYARTAKIKNVVATFEKKLEETRSFENLKENIAGNKEEQEKVRCQIDEVEKKLADGKNAQKYKDEVNKVDMTKPVSELKRKSMQEAVKRITKASEEVSEKKLSKTDVDNYCHSFERLTRDIETEMKEGLGDKITEMVNDTTEKLIAIYREKLASLSAEHDVGSITINPLELVGADFSGMENPEILYEKYKETYKEETGSHKEKNPERKGFFGFFKIWKPWKVNVIDYEDREAVDGSKFADSYFGTFREHIEKLCDGTEKYAKEVTESVKRSFEEKFSELDSILAKKLEELKAYTGSAENLKALLAETEKRLQWLTDIQSRIAAVLDI
ncbi:MAG: dynamin family protein [Tannerellaceae bacterium]|jgi:GTPase Era involved in 16S rRNA processing|nr:dynamin family protein [Tannerellaceae bacterium]